VFVAVHSAPRSALQREKLTLQYFATHRCAAMNTLASVQASDVAVAVDSRSAARVGGRVAQKVSWTDANLLTMYTEPPREELSLHDFEVNALDRLKGSWVRSGAWHRGWRDGSRVGGVAASARAAVHDGGVCWVQVEGARCV